MKSLPVLLGVLFVAPIVPASHAGVRSPGGIPCDLALRSSWVLGPSNHACQYVFNRQGNRDVLEVFVTLRDCFDTPITNCDVMANLEPNASTLAFCSCEPVSQIVATGPDGDAYFAWTRLGGRGTLDVAITALCFGAHGLPSLELQFATPDLQGNCQTGSPHDIINLGIWAGGLPPGYAQPSDYNCSGDVNVVDLAVWASNLDVSCD